jgi:hypothetical protein
LKQKNTHITTELSDGAAVIVVGDDSAFTNMAKCLAEIRKENGVVGYILRSDASAIVDLAEQEKITDYALLSWQIDESSRQMAKQFNLMDIERVVVEGKTVKVLCLNQSKNRASVFIDKTLAFDSIIKKLQH